MFVVLCDYVYHVCIMSCLISVKSLVCICMPSSLLTLQYFNNTVCAAPACPWLSMSMVRPRDILRPVCHAGIHQGRHAVAVDSVRREALGQQDLQWLFWFANGCIMHLQSPRLKPRSQTMSRFNHVCFLCSFCHDDVVDKTCKTLDKRWKTRGNASQWKKLLV